MNEKKMKGYIALCGINHLGIITEDEPQKVNYPDGNSGTAYIGIHLSGNDIGSPWSSRYPKIVCHVDDLIAAGTFSEFLVKARFFADSDCFNESYVIVGDNSGRDSMFESNAQKVRLLPIKEEGE